MKIKTETHTPTPWKQSGSYFDANGRLVGKAIQMKGKDLLSDETEEELAKSNAAFIVRAVNEYESLLKENIELRIQKEKLLEVAKDALCELDPDCKYDGSNYRGEPSDKGDSRIQTILALYEVIAQAEGGK